MDQLPGSLGSHTGNSCCTLVLVPGQCFGPKPSSILSSWALFGKTRGGRLGFAGSLSGLGTLHETKQNHMAWALECEERLTVQG